MIQTGNYFEAITEMLNIFRSEVKVFSERGLMNINKHSENFMKRVLNITYDYELENLNKGKINYPGIDLGDTVESVAYQITSTRKSDKIDNTLSKCLKYKHYETFKIIKVFILTSKQTSYTLTVNAEPHFTFTPEKNIFDFDDLLNDIEDLNPTRTKGLYDYIKSELQPTIEAIRTDKSEDKKTLLETTSALDKIAMTNFFHWRSQVTIKNSNISVPEIHSKLLEFIPTPALKNRLLPILNLVYRKTSSTKEILYLNEIAGNGLGDQYGQAMLIEKSTITIEGSIYSNQMILVNLYQEMLMLLTKIFFFSKYSQHKFEIEVSISMETNTNVHFNPVNSLVLEHVFNTYTLESSFKLEEVITDLNMPTLLKLLQNIIHGFVSNQSNHFNSEPFLTIDPVYTAVPINYMKSHLQIVTEKTA